MLRHRRPRAGRLGPAARSPALSRSRGSRRSLYEPVHRPGDRLRARARRCSSSDFGDRPDGSFQLVFRVRDSRDPALVRGSRRSSRGPRRGADGAADAAPDRRAGSSSTRTSSRRSTSRTRRDTPTTSSVPSAAPRGVAAATSPAPPAIQHDLDPIFNEDLVKGESIALPIAFARPARGLRPLARRDDPVPVRGAARSSRRSGSSTSSRTSRRRRRTSTNLVQLIGLGIAIDYSLLVVYRFREELARGLPADDAVVRTMETAGRAVVFSGATVAIGLALLLFMPLPFIRSIGLGGFLIPLVSIAASLTLQPALLSLYGRRGMARKRVLPRRADRPRAGILGAARARRSCAGRSLYLAVGGTALVAAAVPALWLQLTPGSTFGIPRDVAGGPRLRPPARGRRAGRRSRRRRSLVDSGREGGTRDGEVRAAVARVAAALRRDPEVAASSTRRRPPVRRPERPLRAGDRRSRTHDYGEPEAAGLRAPSSRRHDPGRTVPAWNRGARRRRPAAGRRLPRRGLPLLPAGSCSRCSSSRTSCCCARSARCCCR